ncbi:MAG: hypothetical protein LAT64_11720 [Phycisphaerales bacterium]|nr:hypothetical protein [Planctomycetota bacterium]MCH8509419.1 hypothetical protein [Phycisphaerales bacterium]
MPDDAAKVCVLCGKSCAGQPRIKNGKGQYAHRACAEATRREPEPTPPEDDLMGALLDDIEPVLEPAAGPNGLRAGCPGCGRGVAAGAVICTGCGFNLQTGKGLKTKVSEIKPGKAGAGLGAMAGGAGEFAKAGGAFLLGSAIGGAVAATLGGLIWAGIIIGIERQIGWIAILVGGLCGLGTALGSRGQTGMGTGVIAVVFTILSILGGKYFGMAHLMDKFVADHAASNVWLETLGPEEMADFVRSGMVGDILHHRLLYQDMDRDTREDYEYLMNFGVYPDDYPEDVLEEADERWRGMDEEQRAFAAEDLLADRLRAARPHLHEAGFLLSFSFRDVFFFLFAIGAAYAVGSGNTGVD